MTIGKKALVFLALASLVGCDHTTKHVAKSALAGRGPVTVLEGVFDVRYTENPGVAFSMLTSIPSEIAAPVLVCVGLVLLAAMLALGWRQRGLARLQRSGYLIAAAGAFANILDRGARGYVVDFLHIHHWPVFNLADVFIVVGVVLAAFGGGIRRGSHGEEAKESET